LFLSRVRAGAVDTALSAAPPAPPAGAPSPAPPLEPVGFWCLKSCPRYLSWAAASAPLPCECGLDNLPGGAGAPLPPAARAAVLRYLSRGALESYELAPSWCRVCRAGPDARVLGVASLTDGARVWPSGYAHYVRAHGERPPAALVAAAVAADAAAAGGGGEDDGALEVDAPALPADAWDAEARERRPVPPATLEWLRRAHAAPPPPPPPR